MLLATIPLEKVGVVYLDSLHKVNLCVKEKITKIPKISKLHLEFINGKNIHFDKTNLSIHEPHKIIISNNLSCLILLIFKNDNNITIKRLETLVLQMIS